MYWSMVALDDSHGIMSFNRDNFDLCAHSNCVLAKFLANEVFTSISSDLVRGAQISVYLTGLEGIPSMLCTDIL
jgi:hypothetical protein